MKTKHDCKKNHLLGFKDLNSLRSLKKLKAIMNGCFWKPNNDINLRQLVKKWLFFVGNKSHWRNTVFLGNPISSPSWIQDLIDFYHIWPWHQWLTSLVSLILLYWITGHFYNKWLSDRGGWLTFKMRVWLIISDLTLNLALGIYYMHYRETLMGAIMLTCPIAISPVIFLLEMFCVYIYYRFWKKK